MKLNVKRVFYVGIAFFFISLFWQTYDNIVAKIMIDKFGLTQGWSGAVLALDNVLALVLIPLFGSLSDKTSTKYGKRTPYIVIGTVIAAFAFLSLSFADAKQTHTLETETAIIETYQDVETTDDLSVTQWQAIIDDLNETRNDLLADGRITTDQYASMNMDHLNPLEDYLATEVGTTIDADEQEQINEYFYGYLNQRAWEVTASNPTVFVVFVAVLFIALVSMSTFRSPAVALMPDVTMKPLRSKANAVINLMGTFGGILAILIAKVFMLDNLSYVDYTPAFITVGVLMLVFLAVFLWKVREPAWRHEREEDEKIFGISEEEEARMEGETVEELSREKKISLYLILFSIALWFTGYNAVTSKISDYAPKVLSMGYSMPILIAQGAALLAFVPIGIIATKIGRRKTILGGIIILTTCFGSVYFLTPETSWIMYVLFAFTGVGWATINVNSYPMVVELAKGSNVGKYTGFYYTFSMAAQIMTPILSGIFMDMFGRKALFPYAAFFVAMAFITMLFVKHGDSKVIKKETILDEA